jgi:hypothetical protein
LSQAVSHRPHTADGRVESQASLCEICGRQRGTETGLFSEYFQFPASIILIMLYTDLFVFYRHCIILAIESVVK